MTAGGSSGEVFAALWSAFAKSRSSATTSPMTRLCWLWLLAFGVASSAYCVLASRELGATFDESFYVQYGLNYWRTGSHGRLLRAGTMPLPPDVQTLPLWVWEQARGKPFDVDAELHTVLPVSRAANLTFWWVLLFYAGRLGRLWGGPAAGRWATAVLACEPNLLAHASLATTDIALTAGVLAGVYHFAAGRNGWWWERVFVPGVVGGLALACKASAFTYLPLAWLLVGRVSLWSLVQQVAFATVVVYVLAGTDGVTEPSFIRWANSLPNDDVGNAVRWLANHLAVFSNAGEGIVQQIRHNIRGHDCYVLGRWHERAVWYYFPVVLTSKMPDPLLALTAALLLTRPRRWLNPAGLIAVAYLIFSLSCRVQLGIRLMFPLVAMLNLAAVLAVCRPAGWPALGAVSEPSWRERATLLLLVAVTAVISISWWPNALGYTNHLWGGKGRAAEVHSESNYDWGQGLPALRRWHDARTAADGRPLPLRVWYFGTDTDSTRPPFEIVQVHDMNPASVRTLRERTAGGYFAVGESFFTSYPPHLPGTREVLEWLKGQPPVATVGTFRVYWIDPPHP